MNYKHWNLDRLYVFAFIYLRTFYPLILEELMLGSLHLKWLFQFSIWKITWQQLCDCSGKTSSYYILKWLKCYVLCCMNFISIKKSMSCLKGPFWCLFKFLIIMDICLLLCSCLLVCRFREFDFVSVPANFQNWIHLKGS